MAKANKQNVSKDEMNSLLLILKNRFEKNIHRHTGIAWEKVQTKLLANPKKCFVLNEMEKTGGEPDVVGFDKKNNAFIFYDCAAESPKERRSICYDRAALDARKENKPRHNAIDMAAEIGIDILTEEEYRELQKLGEFDLKTSSWILTPPGVRKLGGALFCDRRFGKVFTYHNGADSYYAARGFRGSLKL